MLMIFAVFVHPLKRISYWKCFHNCVLGSVFIGLPGLQFNFASVGPINSWEHKGWVESNRLSTRIESTLMMSRNDFNLYRVDLYRNDLVSQWPSPLELRRCEDIKGIVTPQGPEKFRHSWETGPKEFLNSWLDYALSFYDFSVSSQVRACLIVGATGVLVFLK